MNSIKIHNSPLAPLLQKLKMAGYPVSIGHMLDIHAFFLSTSLSAVDIGELKYIIAPLIAKSPEDQEKIYRIIDAYIDEVSGKNPRPQPSLIQPRRKRKSLLEDTTSLLIALFSTLFGLLVACVIVFFINVPKTHVVTKYDPPPDTLRVVQPVPSQSSPSVITSEFLPTYEITATQKIMPVAIDQPNVAFRLAILLGILIGVLLSFFIFSVKTKEYNTGESGAHPYLENENITFPLAVTFNADEDKLIKENKRIQQAKKHFEKHMMGTTPVLNIERSIGKTISNGGAYTLWFENAREKRKLVFLIESPYPGSHIEKFFDHLVKKLASEKLHIEKYRYARDIRHLEDVNGKAVSLHEISGTKADHQLIIMGKCENIVPNNEHDEAALRLLLRWASRSVITPVPMQDWEYAEDYLLQKKFNVVPAEIRAVELLSHTILLNGIAERNEVSAKIEDHYSLAGIDLENTSNLRNYLGDENLFQFICSLAVYPKLSWELTISLFDHLPGNRIPAQGQYDILLKIARIPWLNSDRMSDQLRLSLLGELRRATELATRKKILALLKEMEDSIPPGSLAAKELEVQRTLNQFILFAHNKKAFREYSESTKHIAVLWDELKEWSLKKHIDSGNEQLFKEHSGRHQNIQEFFAREKELRKRKITIGRIAVTLIPPAIIYLLMTMFKPGFAYLQGSEQLRYQPSDITLAFTKDACSTADRIEIDAAGSQYTVPMVSTTGFLQLKQVEHDAPIRVTYYYNDLPRVKEFPATHRSFDLKLVGCRPSNTMDAR